MTSFIQFCTMHASDRLFLAKYKMNDEDKNIVEVENASYISYGSVQKDFLSEQRESFKENAKKKWLGVAFCVLSGFCIMTG